MRIAFTHNLKRSLREEEAEFDSPRTVSAITAALEACGHDVVPVDVTGPLPALIDKLKAIDPDLVFNTAEGIRGRSREALYPAVFEELALPYTGSDAYVLTLTLDKYLTKLAVAQHGVRIPRSVFRGGVHDATNGEAYPLPCIVKPNFEGSSKGITDASVVTDPLALNPKVQSALRAYPDGVLIEEYIPGTDVTVGFFEGFGPEILTPCGYEIRSEYQTRHRLYDYTLKNEAPDDAISVVCPARISARVNNEVRQAARRVVKALGIRNVGRVDFRVRDDGTVFFLEANATPSLEEGSSLFVAVEQLGLDYVGAIRHIVDQAAQRWEKQGRTARRAERARRAWMEGHPPTQVARTTGEVRVLRPTARMK